MRAFDVAVIGICAALYAVVGLLTSFGLNLGGVSFWPAVVIPAIFAVLFLLIPLPRALTYITGVWVCRAVVDVLLCLAGTGQYSVTAAIMTARGRRQHVIQEAAKVIGNGMWFGVCIYFFGF